MPGSIASTTHTLPLAGSPRAPLFFLSAIMIVPVIGIVAALGAMHFSPAAASIRLPFPEALLLVPLLLAALTIWLWRSLARAGVRIESGDLIVNTGLGSKRVALSRLHAAGLRVVDLSERPELRPRWRTWGTSLPGFHSGWFRLRNGEKAVCLLLDRRRVSYLRSDDGLSLLLSLERPDELRALIAR